MAELHRHEEGFLLAYVRKGWLDVAFEEIGVRYWSRVPSFPRSMARVTATLPPAMGSSS